MRIIACGVATKPTRGENSVVNNILYKFKLQIDIFDFFYKTSVPRCNFVKGASYEYWC